MNIRHLSLHLLSLSVLLQSPSVFAEDRENAATASIRNFSASSAEEEVIVRVSSRARAIELGLVPITATHATFRGSSADLERLRSREGVLGTEWSPGRRLFMDQAAESIRLSRARADFGVDGSGVVVGTIDTGIDVFHSDFRRADGTTRVRWLLAYDESPRGVHAGLEEEFNCQSEEHPCAVYDAADLDSALALGEELGKQEVPVDSFGHGSHVAGIAAGDGELYPGVAPGADLVIVKGARSVSIRDPRILEGARFIFDRASEMGAPAVINLSLGSAFGAHDGTSELEVVLDALATGPGRIIVVAAGNDGNLFSARQGEPFPVGSHTEVTVPARSTVGLTLFESGSDLEVVERGIYSWIAFSPGDRVSVGLRNDRQMLIEPLPPGQTQSAYSEDVGEEGYYAAYVGNGSDVGLDLGVSGNNAVAVVVGAWPEDVRFEIVLSGRGTARAWVDSFAADGALFSTLFGRARMGGTIGIPATAPRMIAVGASVNRQSWIDFTGEENEEIYGEVGARASFSGAGPNQLGGLKPDLLAPGGNVIAAMSSEADPREEGGSASQFASHGICVDPEVECLVVDDEHGVSSGTSMAAPVVAGAVALLLQRQPALRQEEVRDLLRIGSRPHGEDERPAFAGVGTLDIERLLKAQDALVSPMSRAPTKQSELIFSDVFILPDPAWSLEGLLLLKDEDGLPATGVSPEQIRLEVEGAADVSPLELSAAIQRFRIAGRKGQALQEVTVRAYYNDRLLAEGTLPVVIDAANVWGGLELTGGSCGLSPSGERAQGHWWLAAVLVLSARRRRRAAN